LSVSARNSFIILCLVVPSLAGPAAARTKVVVEKLGGRGTRYVQSAVEEVVKRENDLASAATFHRTAQKKRVSLKKDAGWAKVAKQLGVDAIVSGTLKKTTFKGTRSQYKLALAVREGRSGSATEAVTVVLSSDRPTADDKEAVARALLPVLAKTAPVAGRAEEPVVEVAPTETPKGPAVAQTTEDTEVAPLKADLPGQTIPEAKADVSTSVAAGDELVTSRRYRYGGADVAVGVSFLKRDLTFNSFDALAQAQRPNGYKGGTPVASVSFLGELYPLSFGDAGGPLSGIGVGVYFDRVLTLKSSLGSTEFDTTATGFGVGLRYRFNFGSSPKLPSIKVLFGWNHLAFDVDHGTTDIDLPNVSYSYLDAGIGVRVPLTVPWLALYADARWMFVLSSGEISDGVWYGGGSTKGLDVNGGIEARIAEAWSIRGGVHYRRIAFDFDGTGDKANNRDGNPATQDVGGAVDTYLQFYLLVGYVF
jgi:hypothetical protein